MQLDRFDPPANLNDFDGIPNQRKAWSEMISYSFDKAISKIEANVGSGNSQFYNPMKTPTDDFVEQEIIWEGFPRTLRQIFGEAVAWQKTEELQKHLDREQNPIFTDKDGNPLNLFHRTQDEYCEWHVNRDPATDKILRVTFTCEGPEYWQALAQGYPSPYYYGGRGEEDAPTSAGAIGDKQKLLSLYQKLVSSDVQLEDLLFATDVFIGGENVFSKGDYNPWNKWNTTHGVVHLTHRANTLRAEIQLGADATILRAKNGQLLEDADELICCAGYGGVNRSSDPSIGSNVNELARQGASITLKNPVGLYMDSLDTAGWTKPDGSPVGNYWKIIRGEPGMAVRAVYEVPSSEGFTVSDIQIAGEPIQFGGQIAKHINVKLTGVACRLGQSSNQPVQCVAKCCRAESNPDELKLTPLDELCPQGYQDAFPAVKTLSLAVPKMETLSMKVAKQSILPRSRRLS